MAKKSKGIRERRIDYIKRDIRELKKMGFEISEILKERTMESLAYTKKSYENYRNHIKSLKKKVRTNQHGRTFTKKELEKIKDLEDKFNNLKADEFKKYSAGKNLSPAEKAFLHGKEVRAINNGESMRLSNNFAPVNIFESFQKKDNFDSLYDLWLQDYETFSTNDVVDNGFWFKKLYIDKFEENGKLSSFESGLLMDMYSDLEMVHKMHIKKNIDKLMQIVESATSNRKSGFCNNYFRAIHNIVLSSNTKITLL